VLVKAELINEEVRWLLPCLCLSLLKQLQRSVDYFPRVLPVAVGVQPSAENEVVSGLNFAYHA
jgi:hypothetical protein